MKLDPRKSSNRTVICNICNIEKKVIYDYPNCDLLLSCDHFYHPTEEEIKELKSYKRHLNRKF